MLLTRAKKVDTEFVSKKVEAEGLAEFETDAEFDNNIAREVTCVNPEDRNVSVSIQYQEPSCSQRVDYSCRSASIKQSHAIMCAVRW